MTTTALKQPARRTYASLLAARGVDPEPLLHCQRFVDLALEVLADAALDRYRHRNGQCLPALHIAFLRQEAIRRVALLGWFRGMVT